MSRAHSMHDLTVEDGDAGLRLDVFLARRLPQISRARLQALIRAGAVRLAERVVSEAAGRVKQGDRVRLEVPEAVDARPLPETIPLEVLFEDEHLVVLVKPAGLVVHPAPGHPAGTLVNALLAHCGASLSGIGGVRRPGIVHRLDREVSGVMVAAKHDEAHRGLAGQFTVRSVHRLYEAIAWGVPGQAAGTVDQPLARDPNDRLRMAVVPGGRRAVTHYRLLEAAGLTASRLEVQLETGRTHQIRVHLTKLGNPIMGDRLYGRMRADAPAGLRAKVESLGRVALHARELGFIHPVDGTSLRFAAATPPFFDELLDRARM